MARPGDQTLSVSVGTTDTWVMGPNPKRLSIVVSPPPTNRITLAFGGGAASLDAGINLNPGNPPLVLNFDTLGNAITGEIRAISAVAAQTIGFIEIFDFE